MTPRRASLATPDAFRALWRAACRADLDAGEIERLTQAVMARYREPARCYHTLSHIDFCLGQFQLAKPHLEDPLTTELAIWFHDVIYDPCSTDNEERSAAFFAQAALGAVPAARRARVVKLINVTAYPSQPEATDECFLVDIDLSSFGRPWAAFLRDSINVRRECAHLPDAVYYERQIKFLEGLLGRESFCYTEFFHHRHGRRAIANMRGLIELVRPRLPSITGVG